MLKGNDSSRGLKSCPLSVVSAVIPCREDVLLRRCIDSIDPAVEIVVALNDPTPEIMDTVRSAASSRNLTIVTLKEPGIGPALNAGIRAASREWIFLIDSDCVCRSDTIAGMMKYCEQYRVVRGSVVFLARTFLEKVVALTRHEQVNRTLNALHPPLLFRKDISNAIGPWFSEWLQWSEDADFDKRVRAAGIRIGDGRRYSVEHKPLSVKDDLAHAIYYGVGREIGKEYGVYAPHSLMNTIRSWLGFVGVTASIARNAGIMPVIYYVLLWNSAFRLGSIARRRFGWTPASWQCRCHGPSVSECALEETIEWKDS